GLAELGELAVAAGLDGEVDDDGAGLHRAHRVRADELRRGTAGDERGRDHDVGFGDLLADGFALFREDFRARFLRVAAGVLEVGEAGNLDEAPSEPLDLLLRRVADAGPRDDGAETLRGRDRLETGHARAEDDDARR